LAAQEDGVAEANIHFDVDGGHGGGIAVLNVRCQDGFRRAFFQFHINSVSHQF
jgi:hypothetical protein